MTRESLALAALVERIAPGGRLVRRRRLPGGLGCRMDVLEIERGDGSRWKVSLRRFVQPDHDHSTPERVEHEYEVLRLLETNGVAAPRPVLLDARGEFFGVPAIVLTYLPGRPLFATRNIGGWTKGLAGALRTVHAVTPERADLSRLRVQLYDDIRERIVEWIQGIKGEPLAAEIQPLLLARLSTIDVAPESLIHDDYWPGNTVWYRGRMAGIIDWSSAKVGDQRVDVAACRIDLALSHGVEVADAFRDDYERLLGWPLRDLWYFDLLRGLPPLRQAAHWLEGYHDLGMHHLRERDVKARLRVFL
ncbi:MAG: aminoglycoside phosphotransferase family protein, partial [Dehalococcoidia bacterium]